MVVGNPYQQYRQQSVMSASPGELTLMLYNGAIKFIKQGVLFIEEKNLEKSNNAIQRAQEIIAHLNLTLDTQYAVVANLSSLYNYISSRLVEANIKKDKEILLEVLGFVEDLRDTWTEVIKLVGKQAAK